MKWCPHIKNLDVYEGSRRRACRSKASSFLLNSAFPPKSFNQLRGSPCALTLIVVPGALVICTRWS
jgi:hypothetical protein